MIYAGDDLDAPGCCGECRERFHDVSRPGSLDEGDGCPEHRPILSEVVIEPVAYSGGFAGMMNKFHDGYARVPTSFQA